MQAVDNLFRENEKGKTTEIREKKEETVWNVTKGK